VVARVRESGLTIFNATMATTIEDNVEIFHASLLEAGL
jgi:hypothetical protein